MRLVAASLPPWCKPLLAFPRRAWSPYYWPPGTGFLPPETDARKPPSACRDRKAVRKNRKNWPANAAFLLAGSTVRVSEDCLVADAVWRNRSPRPNSAYITVTSVTIPWSSDQGIVLRRAGNFGSITGIFKARNDRWSLPCPVYPRGGKLIFRDDVVQTSPI